MFNKISIVLSAVAISLLFAVSGSKAVTVTPSFVDIYNYTVDGSEHTDEKGDALADAGAVHVYEFEVAGGGDATNLGFFLDFDNDGGFADFGIADFTAIWSDGAVEHDISDSGSNDLGNNLFYHLIDPGETWTLTLSGTWLDNGGEYTLSVSAVPLPPAVIAFSTAMLGVGFLARRRRKKKAAFA